MTRWIDQLREEIAGEFATAPVIAVLATAGLDGRARGRCVVVRAVEADSGRIIITTDARSEKCRQLARQSGSELVFWLANRKVQWRVAGSARVDRTERELLQRLWKERSDASRATFSWPTPGAPRVPDAEFLLSASADTPVAPDFSLLILEAEEIERLDVSFAPHRRTRWMKETEFAPIDINP